MPVQVLSTQSAAVGAASTRTSLTANNGEVLYVHTATGATTTVYVLFGTSATDATTSAFAIPPGQSHVLVVPTGATHLAHIGSAAGPTTLYMTRGHWMP